MSIQIAAQTLVAIEKALEADQGARYRQILKTVLPHMDDAYRGNEESFRSHMGASLIGEECGRAIWYGWRWVTKPSFPGRILRLFNRGHLEEARFIALLLTIGVQVYQQDDKGKQFRISHANGHFGGSGDGKGIGFPEFVAGTVGLMECKTHGDKSFTQLAGSNWKDVVTVLHNGGPLQNFTGKGVREAHFKHYVQMQVYMRKMGIAVGVYMAVNKNDDSLYIEMLPLDTKIADEFLERGAKLVGMTSPPPKINNSPGFWKCRFCDHRPVCHMGAVPEVNCRTCVYSRPADHDGEWVCLKFDQLIPKELQLTGCKSYERHPDI